MGVGEYTGPVITSSSPKEGSARLVELAVQAMVAGIASPSDRLPALQHELYSSIRGYSVSGVYSRAQSFRQAVFGTLLFEGLRVALPRMAEHHEEHQTLIPPPDVHFNPAGYVRKKVLDELHPTQITALQSAYWLVDGIGRTVRAMRRGNHSLSDLYPYIDSSNIDYFTAFDAWKAGPGRNRWPAAQESRWKSGSRTIKSIVCLNVRQAVYLLSAKAVHHLIHTNPRADAAELDEAVAKAVPRMNWVASTNRHLGWSPDWRDDHWGILPLDGVEALLQVPTSNITEPNAYAASVLGMSIMEDAEFCPHPLVRNGPVARSAACAGDPRASYSEAAARQAAGNFFAQMGFVPENGKYFNPAAVSLAMGRRLVRTIILPVYQANKERSNH